MKIITILKGGIEERHNIRSGRIHKKGSDPKEAKYGVIYSSNPDNKEDNDLGLDSADFEGAWIGPVSAPESDKNQFFTILGAYYYQDNHPDKPKTTKVFGIAEWSLASQKAALPILTMPVGCWTILKRKVWMKHIGLKKVMANIMAGRLSSTSKTGTNIQKASRN